MKTVKANSIEEAVQIAKDMSQPKVHGSLKLVIGKFELSLKTEGMDAATTTAVLKAAFDAATRPSYMITYDPESIGRRVRGG